MLQEVWHEFQLLLALDREVSDVGAVQMMLRTVFVFTVTLILVRVSSRRILGRASAFDFIVAIMLGSVMSRAINGQAPLLPTIAAGIVLLALHWMLALLAYHTHKFGLLVKGSPILLIEEGKVQLAGMRRAKLSANDLAENMRLQTGHEDPARIQRAYFERNGRISIIPYAKEPQVVTVSVENGVQTIRIELNQTRRE